jgi:transaldolase
MERTNALPPLAVMASSGPTEFWNDSCARDELEYAIRNGAVGATSNPVIVHTILKRELPTWEPRVRAFIEEDPAASEDEIAWRIVEEMTARAAELLMPEFEASGGRRGRISVQTNPKFFRDAERMVEQALRLNSVAPNLNIKIPGTKAGMAAAERLTSLGISVNATVNFTVSQAVAVAEAVERGLSRRAAEGGSIEGMSPMCAVMVGRLDDWLKKVAEKKGIITDPGFLEWAGVAVMKKSYRIYKERGYRTRLLAAAYRNHMQWSEFIGGGLSMTIPYEWQLRFNGSDVAVEDRIDKPVDERILDELVRKFPEFRKAYDEDGLSEEEFDGYGATRRTLRQFQKSYDDLVCLIRDLLVPDPDVRGE